MNDEQIKNFKDELKQHIEVVIQAKVNGKIDKISQKLDEYIKLDEAWKNTATPVIKMGTNVKGFGAVAGYFLAFMAALSACWTFIEWLSGIVYKNK
jgi:hypothetical protein